MTIGNPPTPSAISSVVLTLSPTANPASLQLVLSDHPAITLGERQDRYWPAVIEATLLREVHRWLEAQSEIAQVDVVFVSMPEDSAPAPTAQPLAQ